MDIDLDAKRFIVKFWRVCQQTVQYSKCFSWRKHREKRGDDCQRRLPREAWAMKTPRSQLPRSLIGAYACVFPTGCQSISNCAVPAPILRGLLFKLYMTFSTHGRWWFLSRNKSKKGIIFTFGNPNDICFEGLHENNFMIQTVLGLIGRLSHFSA